MRTLALILTFLLISAPTAHAGAWAVTYLDPMASVEAKGANTVGYWVLQHGSHPFAGDLGRTGLKFRSATDERTFTGVPLGEPGHYAVTFNLPVGTYEVVGVQGMFPDHPLGTLTVPGTLLLKPVGQQGVARTVPDVSPWGSIAPPAAAVSAAPVPIAAEEPTSEPVSVWLVGLVVAGAVGLFLVLRRRLGTRRG